MTTPTSSIGYTIYTIIILIFLITAGLGIYFGLKHRFKNKEGKQAQQDEPKFVSQAAYKKGPSYTQASEVELVAEPTWRRLDEVFGMATVDGIDYQTFDAGEVLIHDKKGNPVICFKIDGYGNDQRTINWIKVSEHVDKIDGVIFYVKHNHNDFVLYQNWLTQQMYGGEYSREALEFKNLMEKIGKFNQLLAARKIRATGSRYIVK